MKKVFNVFFGLIAFVGILGAGLLIGGRNILSGNNVTKLINVFVDEEGEDSLTDSMFRELEVKDFREYVDNKQLEKAVGEYISDYFKVEIGVKDELDSSKLADVLKDAAKDYNKDNDEKISTKEIDKAMETLDKEIVKENKLDDDVKKVFKVIFSNTTLFIFIGIAILFLVFIYLVSKSLKTLFFHIGLTTLISGLIIKFGSSSVLNYALNDSSFTGSEEAIKTILNAVGTIGVIGVVIGIICFVLSFIFGRKASSKQEVKHETHIEEIPEENTTKDLIPDAETSESDENTFINENQDL